MAPISHSHIPPLKQQLDIQTSTLLWTMFIHTYIHTYIYTHTHIYIYMFMYTYILWIHIHKYIRIHISCTRRPPIEQQLRDPNFDITIDSLDGLDIGLSDMGNSGGERRDEQKTQILIPIRVSAVNNAPSVNGPSKIRVTEDTPFHFVNAPSQVRRCCVCVCVCVCQVVDVWMPLRRYDDVVCVCVMCHVMDVWVLLRMYEDGMYLCMYTYMHTYVGACAQIHTLNVSDPHSKHTYTHTCLHTCIHTDSTAWMCPTQTPNT
jgi:hypothetical protein